MVASHIACLKTSCTLRVAIQAENTILAVQEFPCKYVRVTLGCWQDGGVSADSGVGQRTTQRQPSLVDKGDG